eukprot:CAMPEP_0196781068 /NCGR_PEP_ID=MMETSP1104-20130614/9029_1 /TAXON_ID=33652 /ORGANISM="Cafeteria sp., Strain Caron Lab Isolate" /LENGTH=568 /DNA_ID=CAMNT_0042151289 /DNA_START=68 /DNA_END=1771 /DNA_ORIENTATION=+
MEENQLDVELFEAAERGDLDSCKTLIARGAKAKVFEDEHGEPLGSALHAATMGGHVGVMKVLIEEADADVTEYGDNILPLCIAAREGHVDAIRLLLDAGAGGFDEEVNNPLYFAADSGHVEACRVLLDAGVSVFCAMGPCEEPPMSAAIRNGHADVVALLLSRGAAEAEFHGTDDDGHDVGSPIQIAVDHDLVDILKLLLNAGIPVNSKNEFGQTALHRTQQLDMFRFLLSHGADPTIPDLRGSTPLHEASIWKFEEGVRLLLELACDPNAADSDGETPLHKAVKGDATTIASMLLRAGGNPLAMDESGVTPIASALESGDTEMLRVFVENGCTAEQLGWTQLHLAIIRNDFTEICARSREGGDIVNQKDDHGCPPLVFAALHGSLETLRVLLRAGATVDEEDLDGNTALDIACACRTADFVRLLTDSGARLPNRDWWENSQLLHYREKNLHLLLSLGADPIPLVERISSDSYVSSSGPGLRLASSALWLSDASLSSLPWRSMPNSRDVRSALRDMRRLRDLLRPLVDPRAKTIRSRTFRASILLRLPWHVRVKCLGFLVMVPVLETW